MTDTKVSTVLCSNCSRPVRIPASYPRDDRWVHADNLVESCTSDPNTTWAYPTDMGAVSRNIDSRGTR